MQLLATHRSLLLICRMLIAAQQTVGLKRYTVEDAAFGYWLQAWDLRHINQTRFRCACWLCCIPYDSRKTSNRLPEGLALAPGPSQAGRLF